MSSGSPSFKEPQPIEPGDSGPNSGRNSYPATNHSTASVRESIYNYEEQYGRTYHAFRRDLLYSFPNDEPEQDRMDLHYHCLRMLMKERHWLCPIKSPKCVLDVGAGTGIWPIDVADDHPNAKVIGVDISPIQPTAVRICGCSIPFSFLRKGIPGTANVLVGEAKRDRLSQSLY